MVKVSAKKKTTVKNQKIQEGERLAGKYSSASLPDQYFEQLSDRVRKNNEKKSVETSEKENLTRTSGKGGGLDSQGFSGSGHGDQRVPVIDHTGIGFREDLRRGKGTFGTAGDRKCGRRASGAGGGFSRCHPQQHRRTFAVTASGGVCGSASGDFVYCVFDQVCGSFYGDRQR